MPIIRSIQHVWPDCDITWIIGKFEHKLVGDIPGIEFVTFDKKAGYKGFMDVKKKLAGRTFDVLLHMQVAMRANLLSGFVKAKVRLGYDKDRAKDGHGLFINYRIPARSGQHVVDCFFSFLQTLGIKEADLQQRWEIPYSESDAAFATEHLPDDKPNLIISPCSSHPLRNWSIEGYAAAADYAARTYGMRVILSGGPNQLERDTAAAIETAMETPAINLVGKDTLKQLLAMLDRADLVISPDSGPAHMASSVNTPVIGLCAASNVRRSGPYRFQDLSVDAYDRASQKLHNKPASQLKWGTKLESEGIMDLITIDEVKARIDRWAIDTGTASVAQ